MATVELQEEQIEEAEKIIQKMGEGLKTGRLANLKTYNNSAIHEIERARIFGMSWVFIGHETEIPEPGDYVRRYIAGDPYIFVRDEGGDVHLFFDCCRHRGAELCRSEKGNTSTFRCPYHGWTYKNNGELIGVPKQSTAFQGLDKSEWGLESAHNIDSYNGLVFATLNPNAPSLEDYLGGMKWYLDLVFDLTKGGMQVLGEPHRHIVENNWKIPSENGAGDPYHTDMTHRSILEIGLREESDSWVEQPRYLINDCNGHSLVIGVKGDIEDDESLYWGLPDYIVDDQLNEDGLTEDQMDIAKRGIFYVGNIFPNLVFTIHMVKPGSPDREYVTYADLRLFNPDGPDKTERWSWMLGPAELTDDDKDLVYKAGMSWNGPSGHSEMDDINIWKGIEQNAGGLLAQEKDFELNYQMGLEDISNVEINESWPGPGTAISTLSDANQRTFYEHWYQFMSNGNSTNSV